MKPRDRRSVVSALAGTALAAVLALPAPAGAAVSINVPCSVAALRQAITSANNGGGGTLSLAPGCTYSLTAPDNRGTGGDNGLPVIASAISVSGNGATIRRAPGAPSLRILELAAGASLTAGRLTISDGLLPGSHGGGIYNGNGATLSLTGVTLTGNRTPTTEPPLRLGFGGAVFNAGNGRVTLVSSDVRDNGDHTQLGGGVENAANGTVDVRTTSFVGNRASAGGALHSGGANGSMRVRNSTFDANVTTEAGAGIDNDAQNHLEVLASAFRNNDSASGAGIFNGGTATVSGSSFAGNTGVQGAGLFNGGTATVGSSTFAGGFTDNGGGVVNEGLLTMTGSSLLANQALVGGGLQNTDGAVAFVTNSTITGNVAFLQVDGTLGDGGGIDNDGSLTLTATRVTRNRAAHDGGGVYNAGQLNLQGGSAVAGNIPNDCVNRNGGVGC